jgi:hypothetical protein
VSATGSSNAFQVQPDKLVVLAEANGGHRRRPSAACEPEEVSEHVEDLLGVTSGERCSVLAPKDADVGDLEAASFF